MTVAQLERPLDAADRRILVATQGGLPLVPRPYHAIGEKLGLASEEVMARVRGLLECGVIRRIAAVPNHYALGYRANGMSVWDIDDAGVDELGLKVGTLPFVSHCYRRPRVLPDWPYNLFAMVHATTRLEVAERVAMIAELAGDAARSYDILFSTKILKKTGLRLGHQPCSG
jgi:DNA-binding Lrp family transcriptional regulator